MLFRDLRMPACKIRFYWITSLGLSHTFVTPLFRFRTKMKKAAYKCLGSRLSILNMEVRLFKRYLSIFLRLLTFLLAGIFISLYLVWNLNAPFTKDFELSRLGMNELKYECFPVTIYNVLYVCVRDKNPQNDNSNNMRRYSSIHEMSFVTYRDRCF